MDIETKTISKEEVDAAPSKRYLPSRLSPAMRWSLLTCLLAAFTFSISQLIFIFKPYGFLSVITAGFVIFFVALIASALLTLIMAAFKRLHWMTSFVFFVSVFLCITSILLYLYIVPLLIFCMTAVYFAVMCATGRYMRLSKPKKILRYSLLGVFSAMTLFMFILTFYPGSALKADDRPEKAVLALPHADRIQNTESAMDDPSIPGDYPYSVYYYATPNQKLVPYAGQEVISTQPVDASELLKGWSFIRKRRLGFEPETLPLNAQVWMPEGNGLFPLTLIVHGNHESGDRSDNGYAYLGELLASRGIIAVSVDENFLNSSSLYDLLFFAGLEEENDARAFILLEHLRQWYEWNSDASSLFFNKVDFDNLALVGHSRGGEAVAVAAAYAQLKYYPDNGTLKFDYPFKIKTVAAIAPVHRQYDPANLELSLKNINYLVLQGEHDMDVSSFMGANMYRKVDVSDGGIKAQVWMQYANHGQFNSSWGAADLPGLMSLAFNGRLLMSMEEQQQAAKVFIGSFLEATLLGRDEYIALFKDFAYGGEWLPPALYITDYADSRTVLLDSFDDGFDLSLSSSGKVSYSAQGFDLWTENKLPGKGENSNRVLILAWGSEEYADKNAKQTPVFKTVFQQGSLTAGDKLYVSLCSRKQNEDISFQVRLTDSSGNSFSMSINDFGGVVNPIEAPIAKPLYSMLLGTSEPVLQMVCIPTEQFGELHGDIVSMEWIFDNTYISKDGQVLYADDLRVEKSKPKG